MVAFILCGIAYGLLYCFLTESECLPKTVVNLVSGPEGFFESLFDFFLFLNISISEKITAIVTSYLLSCLIIFLYDKYKK